MARLGVKTGLLSMLRLPGSKNCRLANHNDAARTKPARSGGPSRTARLLALAHHVEGLIDAGELSGYSEAARALGLTRARLTQVMGLALVASAIQERVLARNISVPERRLRHVVREPEWEMQVARLTKSSKEAAW